MIQFFVWIISLLAINNIIAFTPGSPLWLYYGIALLTFSIYLYSTKIKVNQFVTYFIIAVLLSILVNNIPKSFFPIERFIAFIVMLLLLSPWIENDNLKKLREQLFITINWILIAIVIVSFFGKISGLLPGMGRSGFQGITKHSMLLGPISGVVLIILIWRSVLPFNKLRDKYFFIFLIPVSFLTLLLTASRSSLIAMIIGTLVVLIKKNSANLGILLRYVTILITTLILFSGIWISYTDKLQEKFETGEKGKDILYSRSKQWDYRIREFKESPILGIGYSNMKWGLIGKTQGTIEPGSSWLAIISMTGLCGGIFFLLFLLQLISKLNQKSNNTHPLLFGIIFFLIVHWIFEGYLLSAGGFLFFYSWLTLGVVNADDKSDIQHFLQVTKS